MAQHSDVIIIGAGPIGCLAALSLGHSGIRSTLLDQASHQNIKSAQLEGRTIALSHASIEFIKTLHLWPALENQAAPILDIIVSNGLKGQSLHYGQRESQGLALGYNVNLSHLKHVLLEAVQAHPSIDFIAPFEVARIDRTSHAVAVSDVTGHTISAPTCLASDGKNSKTREYLDLSIRTWNYDQVAFVFNVRHEKAHQNIAYEAFLETGPFASLPMVDAHHSSIIWTLSTHLADTHRTLDSAALELLLNNTYPTLGKAQIISPLWTYPLSGHRIPKNYKGRVLLLGDAAHSMHPVAGQGLNVGIGDVMTLTPMLKEHRRLGLDLGDHSLFRDFCRKRQFDVRTMIIATDGLVRLFSNDSPTLNFLRDNGLKFVERSSFLKRIFATKAMGKSEIY